MFSILRFITKKHQLKGKLIKTLLILVLILLIISACGAQPTETSQLSLPTNTATPPTPTEVTEIDGISVTQVIFSIGQRDNKYNEFTAREFRGYPNYECTVGIDCDTETFPILLTLSAADWFEEYGDSYSEFAGGDVESIKIHFTLSQDYEDLTLRISRGGDETLFITLDDKEPLSVTGEMLGSADYWSPGYYDVNLSPAAKGSHTLLFTIHPSDGYGYPFFVWDSLMLFTGIP